MFFQEINIVKNVIIYHQENRIDQWIELQTEAEYSTVRESMQTGALLTHMDTKWKASLGA